MMLLLEGGYLFKKQKRKELEQYQDFFMYDTSLGKIEERIMLASNFLPRRSWVVIQNYFNYEENNSRSRYYTNTEVA